MEVAPENAGQRPRQQRLARPGNVLEQRMTAAQQCYEELLERIFATHHRGGHRAPDRAYQLGDIGLGCIPWCRQAGSGAEGCAIRPIVRMPPPPIYTKQSALMRP